MIIQSRYGKITVPEEEDLITTSLCQYGEWAQLELELLAHFIEEGSCVVDGGAFLGTHSRSFAEMVGPEGRVHAFEPNPFIYPYLKKNCTDSPSSIVTYPYGLGKTSEERVFVDTWQGKNYGGLRLEEGALESSQPAVPVKPFDTLCLDNVDFFKLDVEGMECEVLAGASKTIAASYPLLFVEVNELDASLPLLEWAKRNRYCSYGVNTAAFNPENYNLSTEDIFSHARECGLLLIPFCKIENYVARVEHLALPEIATADALALLLLHKPQYPYEILTKTSVAEKLGINYPAPSVNDLKKQHASQRKKLVQTIKDYEEKFVNLE